MEDRKPIEMVRLEREEELYDREQVLGRDVTSVFPTQSKDHDPLEAMKEAIGAKKFISESELAEIKAARGLSADDGTIAADKPLAEVLMERKAAKQHEFEDKWRQMKQGKNRPLTDEEYEFLDSVAEEERRKEEQQREEEEQGLRAFREERERMIADSSSKPDDLEVATSTVQAKPLARPTTVAGGQQPPAARKPLVRAVVKAKPRGRTAQQQQQRKHPGDGGELPDAKKQKPAQPEVGEKAGLAGLLGDYSSGSESSEG